MTETTPLEFIRFFDDAAVFPPGLAPLDQAVADHVARRGTALDETVGPLVLPLDDLSEAKKLAAQSDLPRGPVEVSVVTPAGQLAEALAARPAVAPELQISGIELKTTLEPSAWKREIWEAGDVDDLEVFVEVNADQIAGGAVDVIAETGVGLKFRTGGIKAELFPSSEQLADVIVSAVESQVTFKLTAGLHQAIRHTKPDTGFTHYGFLNIAVATDAARDDATREQIKTILEDTDAVALATQFRNMRRDWRDSFSSFGTCSVAEPAESLIALNLMPADVLPDPSQQKG